MRNTTKRESREFFRIRKYGRRYDRRTGKFIIDIGYETATEITPRTIAVAEAFGLGQKLAKETLEKCGTPYVETTAVMARYNPFFEKAGLTKTTETTPPNQALTIREALSNLGFNITLLASQKTVLKKLQSLSSEELAQIRHIFIKTVNPKFMKQFSHQPYGKRQLYIKKVQVASIEKLAKLIHVTALLLQTKAYLFWKKGARFV